MGASAHEISRAGKQLLIKYHPDWCASQAQNEQAEVLTQAVNEVYEVLKDPEKPRLYDQGDTEGFARLNYPRQPAPYGSMEDPIFV